MQRVTCKPMPLLSPPISRIADAARIVRRAAAVWPQSIGARVASFLITP
jgi:hypothetical protein